MHLQVKCLVASSKYVQKWALKHVLSVFVSDSEIVLPGS